MPDSVQPAQCRVPPSSPKNAEGQPPQFDKIHILCDTICHKGDDGNEYVGVIAQRARHTGESQVR